jgi:hypothetical protein
MEKPFKSRSEGATGLNVKVGKKCGHQAGCLEQNEVDLRFWILYVCSAVFFFLPNPNVFLIRRDIVIE